MLSAPSPTTLLEDGFIRTLATTTTALPLFNSSYTVQKCSSIPTSSHNSVVKHQNVKQLLHTPQLPSYPTHHDRPTPRSKRTASIPAPFSKTPGSQSEPPRHGTSPPAPTPPQNTPSASTALTYAINLNHLSSIHPNKPTRPDIYPQRTSSTKIKPPRRLPSSPWSCMVPRAQDPPP